MPVCVTDVHRLLQLIEGLVDADILLTEEADAILVAVESAQRSLREGRLQAARQHIQESAMITEALIRSDALSLKESLSFTTALYRTLNEENNEENNEAGNEESGDDAPSR
jgi:hypothetical protein